MECWSKSLDFNTLSLKYGTPLYVINLQQIKRNIFDYLALVGKFENIIFPIKANPSLPILRCIESMGCSVDCASQTEIRLAGVAGFSPQRMVYNTPAPDMSLVFELLQTGTSVVLDSEDMVRQIEKHFVQDIQGRILLRVNPEVSFDYSSETEWKDMVSHGHNTTKFGIPSENVISILKEMRHQVCGLHIHIGTQMDNVESFKRMLTFLHQLVDTIHSETKHKIRFLDLGGGLGIPFTEEDHFPSIKELTASLLPIKRSGMEYWIEPGHSLVGDAVGLLTKVIAMKTMRGKRWGIIDVGTDQLAKITLLRWPHQVMQANHEPLSHKGPDSLGGPLCFSGDTLLQSTQLDNVKQGDHLFIQHCGAYCYALGNSFNGRVGPAHLIIEDENVLGLAKNKEGFFENPNLLSYNWLSQTPQVEDFSFKFEELNGLSSQYLREDCSEDMYQIIQGKRLAQGSYQFEIEIQSKVNFVSMPFIIRLAGDAAIIATCDFLGKTKKDIDVWGSRLMMRCPAMISTNEPIICQINLSGLSTQKYGSKHSILAQFSLNKGKSNGTFCLSFEN